MSEPTHWRLPELLQPVPPKGINLNVPMSDSFKKVVASPTDSGDPAVY